MNSISSDSCVWIDFQQIDEIAVPFKLPFKYLMYEETLKQELALIDSLDQKLIELGLCSVNLLYEEIRLVIEYQKKYIRLSRFDCIALAIAKNRHIMLLTNDKCLRQASKEENVNCLGTLGLIKKLFDEHWIDSDLYTRCLIKLEKIHKERRLPLSVIKEMLEIKI